MTHEHRLMHLSEGILAARKGAASDTVTREAVRALRNVCATSIGGLETPGVRAARAYYGDSTPRGVRLFGTRSQMSAHGAALVVGLSAHMEDFDDTHVGSSVHASAAAFAAAVAAAQTAEANASQLCAAFALGCEIQFRIGRAMMPWHYERGWHITGTVGPIGAAVAVGILHGLRADQLGHAIGFACSQSLGLREAFGTSAKPFHPGKAAANGLLAAEMAAAGLHASPDALFGSRGYYEVLSDEHRPERVLDGLGEQWLLLENTYKPYPCGLVIHSLIDLGILLRESGVIAESVESIQVRCHPIVRELTGNPEPTTPLEARFSAVHGLALGLVFGRAGTEEFDISGLEGDIVPDVRRRVELIDDDVFGWTGCSGVARLRSGDVVEAEVPVARGSLARPLSDEELWDKFDRNVSPRLGEQARLLWETIGQVPQGDRLDDLLTASAPKRAI